MKYSRKGYTIDFKEKRIILSGPNTFMDAPLDIRIITYFCFKIGGFLYPNDLWFFKRQPIDDLNKGIDPNFIEDNESHGYVFFEPREIGKK